MIAIITAASFGFALHAAGYLAVSQEIDRISERYHPIGSLSSPDGLVTEGVALVAESPYVELADVSRTCPAILSDLYNVDLDGKSSDDGTERNGEGVQVSDLMVWGKVVKEIGYDEPDMRRYVFRVEKSVYGYPEYAKPGKQIILEVENAQKAEQEGRMLEEGKTYLVKGYPPKEANNGNYGEMMIVRLEPLEEGVLFWEGEPDAEISRQYVDEYDMLQERNRHALVACTTKDMSAMPQVQESARDFYLEEGRWLDRRDQEEGRRVCVVMKEFANIRSLSVGDTLTLTLQDKMLYYMGYSTSWNDTWETADKTEVTLEIVGIYGRLYGGLANSPSWAELTVRNNFIYIPDSSMPEHYAADQEIWQDSFSFVLNDPKEKEVFVSGITQKLAAEGLSVNFAESNWDAFYRPARAIRQGERNSFLLFTTVAALLLGVVAFSYGWQRKREIAIARAAGIPAKTTAICASVPMLVFGTGSILAGGILGWDYGLRQAERTLAKVEESSRTQLSALWMAGICLALWLFLVIVLLGGDLGLHQKNGAGAFARRNSCSAEETNSKSKTNGRPCCHRDGAW